MNSLLHEFSPNEHPHVTTTQIKKDNRTSIREALVPFQLPRPKVTTILTSVIIC